MGENITLTSLSENKLNNKSIFYNTFEPPLNFNGPHKVALSSIKFKNDFKVDLGKVRIEYNENEFDPENIPSLEELRVQYNQENEINDQQITKLNEQIKSQEQQNKDLNDNVKNLKNDLIQKQQQIIKLNEQIKSQEQQNKDLNENNRNLKDELIQQQTDQDIDTFRSINETRLLEDAKESIENDLKNCIANKNELEKTISSLKNEIIKLKDNTKNNPDYQKLANENESLKNNQLLANIENENLIKETTELKNQIKENETKISKLEADNLTKQQECKTQEQNQDLQTNFQLLQKSYDKLNEKYKEKEKIFNDLNKEYGIENIESVHDLVNKIVALCMEPFSTIILSLNLKPTPSTDEVVSLIKILQEKEKLLEKVKTTFGIKDDSKIIDTLKKNEYRVFFNKFLTFNGTKVESFKIEDIQDEGARFDTHLNDFNIYKRFTEKIYKLLYNYDLEYYRITELGYLSEDLETMLTKLVTLNNNMFNENIKTFQIKDFKNVLFIDSIITGMENSQELLKTCAQIISKRDFYFDRTDFNSMLKSIPTSLNMIETFSETLLTTKNFKWHTDDLESMKTNFKKLIAFRPNIKAIMNDKIVEMDNDDELNKIYMVHNGIKRLLYQMTNKNIVFDWTEKNIKDMELMTKHGLNFFAKIAQWVDEDYLEFNITFEGPYILQIYTQFEVIASNSGCPAPKSKRMKRDITEPRISEIPIEIDNLLQRSEFLYQLQSLIYPYAILTLKKNIISIEYQPGVLNIDFDHSLIKTLRLKNNSFKLDDKEVILLKEITIYADFIDNINLKTNKINKQDLLYNFSDDLDNKNKRIIKRFNNEFDWFKLSKNSIHTFGIKVVDQNDNLLDFKNNEFSLIFKFKQR